MGIKASKKEILQMVEKSSIFYKPNYVDNEKIEYKFVYHENLNEEYFHNYNEKKEPSDDENDSFIFSGDDIPTIDDPKANIKKTKKFPYSAVGTMNVQFPASDEIFEYTCFLIGANVVVTLASNLENKSKGGRALLIQTSFKKQNVGWKNIYIQGKDDSLGEKNEEEEKNKKVKLDDLSSKLAVILYDSKISDEWLGVEKGEKEYFRGGYIHAVFSFKEKNFDDNTTNEKEKFSQSKFREVYINQTNPFLDASKKGDKENVELIKQSPGSPLYYKDLDEGAYVIAIINEFFEFQCIDKKTFIFLAKLIRKGELLLKKKNKNFDDENVFQLNLQRHNLGPSEIYYITDFDFKNLKILYLSDNLIHSQGALYLSKCILYSLNILNLNNNEIGDEGLKHISNAFYSKLNILCLFNNNISSKGIKYFVKSEFINNLIILTLSENRKICDNGIKYIKEHKGWNQLTKLNLDFTGLTDISLDYISQFSMCKLKKLNIQGNKFTNNATKFANIQRGIHIQVNCRTIDERKRKEKNK